MSEQPQAAPGGPGLAGHPELEELAALAEGKLSRTDAARVRTHLDSCEECFEVFAETLHLMEELEGEESKPGGDVLPFPFDEHRKTRPRWAAATIAALLLAGLGSGLWRSLDAGAGVSLADLAEPLGRKGIDLNKLAWGETLRGEGDSERTAGEAPAFQLGVTLLNLQVALRAKDWSAADSAAAHVNGILGINGQRDARDGAPAAVNYPFLDISLRNFYDGLRRQIKAEQQGLVEEVPKQAKALLISEYFKGDQPYYDLGMWAEAGRLATTQQSTFPQKKLASRLLRQLQKYKAKEKDADLPERVVNALETIDQLPNNKYSDLKSAFETILGHYYQQGQPIEP